MSPTDQAILRAMRVVQWWALGSLVIMVFAFGGVFVRTCRETKTSNCTKEHVMDGKRVRVGDRVGSIVEPLKRPDNTGIKSHVGFDLVFGREGHTIVQLDAEAGGVGPGAAGGRGGERVLVPDAELVPLEAEAP